MAQKTVTLSDISGEEVTDDQHARVTVRHPDQAGELELDMSVEEASKLVNTTLRLFEFTIYEPNKPPRTALVETKTVDTLFKDVDFDTVLASARKAATPAGPRRGRPAKSAAPRATGDRVDYTAPDQYGKLHRGRVTEEEKALVKANRDTASYNRNQQTGKPIDWDDPAEVKRYSL